ncbi:MAG TPA: MtrB/PioB family outer membrane beta-barrel protein [Casimicrobiaceae bacterium]
MTKKLLSAAIASLFTAGAAFAQTSVDPMRVEGSATIGGIYNRQSAQDPAKLEEYRDLGNGVLSSVFVRGRNSTNWFDGYGENFGRDDQYMFLRGGIYDVFKAGAYLNDIPHDFALGARTPYSGIGTSTLIATFPNINPDTWNTFDLGYKRRDAGGYFEWQKNSPWYFRVDGNEVKFNGTKVGSGANGTSPGNGFVDLAFPTQYKTANFGVEGGYQTSKATLSMRWDYSRFDNANETLNWTNPFFGQNLLDTSYLPPDNTFNKFTLTGNYRDLPWRSVVSARYTWARTTSSVDLGQTALTTGPIFGATLPDTSIFHGEHVDQSLALSWTAVPMTNVDTRVYYYWTKRENNSDQIQYGNAPTQPIGTSLGCGSVPGLAANTFVEGNCVNELFSYRKNDVGFDVWWRFARNQRLGFGYDYLDLHENRIDYDNMHQSKAWIEYKNTMLDTLTGRLKYAYINRDATSNFSNDGVSPNDPNFLLPFTSAFDTQSSKTNQVKLDLDWSPIPFLGLSFEGTWAHQNFEEHTLGRADNKRQGYFLSGNWGIPDKLLLNAFASWEETKYPSDHRYINTVSNGPSPPPGFCTTANPACYDPNAFPTSNSYNWSSQTKDETWMAGIGADWPVLPSLLIKTSFLYVKNNGNATFSSQDATGQMVAGPAGFGNPLNIGNFDDSTQQYFNLKAIWAYNKNWSFTAGYAYEKYSHSDVGTDGYQYTLPFPPVATNTSLSYLNGYDAFTNGHQNIFYLTATYSFEAPPLPPARIAEAPRAAPAAAPPAPPPPAPPPPPPAPQVQRITLDSKVLFDFDKAVVKPEGKAAIDSQVVGKLAQVQKLEVVLVTGHTDRLGSDAYNQKLSERRADAVRDYLVSKGVPRDKIETIGMGEKQPVVQCDQKNTKELIACLQPNRRVDVQVKGESAH